MEKKVDVPLIRSTCSGSDGHCGTAPNLDFLLRRMKPVSSRNNGCETSPSIHTLIFWKSFIMGVSKYKLLTV